MGIIIINAEVTMPETVNQIRSVWIAFGKISDIMMKNDIMKNKTLLLSLRSKIFLTVCVLCNDSWVRNFNSQYLND